MEDEARQAGRRTIPVEKDPAKKTYTNMDIYDAPAGFNTYGQSYKIVGNLANKQDEVFIAEVDQNGNPTGRRWNATRGTIEGKRNS